MTETFEKMVERVAREHLISKGIPDAAAGVLEVINLLKIWQTWLGPRRGACDDPRLWDRIDNACAMLLASTADAVAKDAGWQPIETAPKDGTEIIIMDGVGGIHGAKWCSYRGKTDWFHHTNLGWIPSAYKWMPLPEAPSAAMQGKEEK